jgi:pyruvate formate lyase activating enzyme
MGAALMKTEARYYRKLDDARVKCLLCPHECVIAPSKTGICRIRQNKDGILYQTAYAEVASIASDPIEKKPLYHFYPGADILSVATIGCNLGCLFCQNWQISQTNVPTRLIPPAELVKLALERNSVGIAYTYSEPLVWFEYVLDTSRLIREAGLKNVLVTNGLINPEPLDELLPFIDAMNIDLKAMDEGMYRKVCKGPLDPVLHTIEAAHRRCHVEITNLIIPTLNDSDEQLEELSRWIAGLDKNIPLHFSRYHPQYKMSIPPTPLSTLERADQIARQHLRFVYLGNVAEGNDTICPGCSRTVIVRSGYFISKNEVQQSRCIHCGEPIPIVGS